MPSWLKIVLAIMAFIAALAIAGGFLAYHWAMRNKDQFMAMRRDGIEFGRGKEATQCIDAALAKLDGSLMSTVKARTFVSGCLSTATASATLCADVPPPIEIMRSAKWSLEQCRAHPTVDQRGCTQVFQEVEQYCQHH
jgi:hypothetical protein